MGEVLELKVLEPRGQGGLREACIQDALQGEARL